MMDAVAASAPFRARAYGDFTIMVTATEVVGGEHVILSKGSVRAQHGVLCRVSSRCLTSTALDAADCDCAGQLAAALANIRDAGRGVLIYMDQEGRGHGLRTKIHAMNGKARGLDTFAAVEELGLETDVREYSAVRLILDALEIMSVTLMTNNPAKVDKIKDAGVVVDRVTRCLASDPPRASLRHLAAKRLRGHSV